jgi:hypothetical protein
MTRRLPAWGLATWARMICDAVLAGGQSHRLICCNWRPVGPQWHHPLLLCRPREATVMNPPVASCSVTHSTLATAEKSEGGQKKGERRQPQSGIWAVHCSVRPCHPCPSAEAIRQDSNAHSKSVHNSMSGARILSSCLPQVLVWLCCVKIEI